MTLLHTSAGSTDTNTVTTPALNTSGLTNAVIALCISTKVGQEGTVNISDSAGNSWTGTAVSQGADGTFGATNIYIKLSPTLSASHTFTMTNTAGQPAICVIVADGATAFDHQASTDGTGAATSIQTGSVSPTTNNELFIASLVQTGVGATGTTIDSGFTVTDAVSHVSSQHIGAAAAYFIQTTGAALNPTWSWSTTTNPGAAIVTLTGSFTPGGGGGGGGTGGGLLLFGGSVGWTPLLRPLPLLGAAAALKAGELIRSGAKLSRRSLLIGHNGGPKLDD